VKLTRGEREVLQRLHNQTRIDIVYEKGAGWWLGNRRLSSKLAKSLLQKCLIRADSMNSPGVFERYIISPSGERALDGEPPYRRADGRYVDALEEIMRGGHA
jgi:hypothetical protein